MEIFRKILSYSRKLKIDCTRKNY